MLFALFFTLSTLNVYASVPQAQCKNHCETEQLINCHKNMKTLSIADKAQCSKLASDCQTCNEGTKPSAQKTEHAPCQDVCSTDKLLECTKNFATLSIQQKAFCTTMTANCQDCPKGD